MICNVRGALGNQILEYLGYLALALETNQKIDAIYVNTGGDSVETTKVDYLSQIFDDLPVVKTVHFVEKLGVWNKKYFSLILSHQEEILNTLKLKPLVPLSKRQTLMHIRAGDRQPISEQTYLSYKGPLDCIIGDNVEVLERVSTTLSIPYSTARPVEDWFRCLWANKIIGGPSSFTLSALFLRPLIELQYFKNQTGPTPLDAKDLELIDYVGQFFSRFRWIHNDG